MRVKKLDSQFAGDDFKVRFLSKPMNPIRFSVRQPVEMVILVYHQAKVQPDHVSWNTARSSSSLPPAASAGSFSV